jgi:alkylation response protein AidB-like acyl-CoA dehydrogenase
MQQLFSYVNDFIFQSNCYCIQQILTLVFIFVIHKIFQCLKIDSGKCDDETIELLRKKSWKDLVPKECQPIVRALESAKTVNNEAACAAQMRDIVAKEYLKFSTLVNEPETLLRCSSGMQGSNGALWTRFTVQYNLYSGSIVAMGSDEQRQELFDSQKEGQLGCFAFTEKGAGVLSGAGVETTAKYDKKSKTFVIHSPTESSTKNWISQGCYAERAVILAELFVDGVSHGPHLFWAQIANRESKHDVILPFDEVTVGTNPEKTTMLGLDNATIKFNQFRIPESSLLSRFGQINPTTGKYEAKLPKNCKRTLDLLLSRLLTGRIVLSEATLAHAMSRIQHNFAYCEQRELWKGRKPKGRMMSQCSLIRKTFRDYSRTTAILQSFIANTRERVADAIRNQSGFTDDLIEATCMCKFLGTGFGVDCVSVIRKTMGARSLQVGSMLGDESFLPNATSAAEGDNTIMELKVVQDIVRGRTSKFPWKLMLSVSGTPEGRNATLTYLSRFGRALLLGKKAIKDGQLLRDIAWSRAHLRVISNWLHINSDGNKQQPKSWLTSYGKVAMRFPVPTQM